MDEETRQILTKFICSLMLLSQIVTMVSGCSEAMLLVANFHKKDQNFIFILCTISP
jgi:hypothetical protein